MTLKVKRCLICRKVFTQGRRNPQQKVCPGIKCQKERKRRKWRRWAAGHRKQRRDKLRLWAQAYPHYWRRYRKSNDHYRAQDNARRKKAHRRRRRAAKQTHFKTLYIEKLRSIQASGTSGKNAAKPTPMQRRINDVLECLIWRESAAKQTHIETVSAGGG